MCRSPPKKTSPSNKTNSMKINTMYLLINFNFKTGLLHTSWYVDHGDLGTTEIHLPLYPKCWHECYTPLYIAVITFLTTFYFSEWMHICRGAWVSTCYGICVDVKGQCLGVSSFFLPCVFQRLSQGQTLCSDPSDQLMSPSENHQSYSHYSH